MCMFINIYFNRSFMPQDNYVSSNERSVAGHLSQPRNPVSNQPNLFHALLKETEFLTSEECYKLFYQRLVCVFAVIH